MLSHVFHTKWFVLLWLRENKINVLFLVNGTRIWGYSFVFSLFCGVEGSISVSRMFWKYEFISVHCHGGRLVSCSLAYQELCKIILRTQTLSQNSVQTIVYWESVKKDNTKTMNYQRIVRYLTTVSLLWWWR